MVDGEKMGAQGFQGPYLEDGSVDTTGGVSLQSPHPQVMSPHIQNAFLQADGFGRGVLLRAPVARGPEGTRRIWKLDAPP